MIKLIYKNIFQKNLNIQHFSTNKLNGLISDEVATKNEVDNDSESVKLHEPVLLDRVLEYIVDETPTYKVKTLSI